MADPYNYKNLMYDPKFINLGQPQDKMQALSQAISYGTATEKEIKEFLLLGIELYIDGKIESKRLTEGISYIQRKYPQDKVNTLMQECIGEVMQKSRVGSERYKFCKATLEVYAKIKAPKEPRIAYKGLGIDRVWIDEASKLDQLDQQKSATEVKQALEYMQQKLDRDFLQSHKKYDEISDEASYKVPESEIPNNGELQMLGYHYVNEAKISGDRKEYRHLRAVLQKLWDMTNAYPSQRFDIDQRFAYQARQLASYIANSFGSEQINRAHDEARASYKGRGRPSGARNRDKVLDQSPAGDPILGDMPKISPDELEALLEASQQPEAPAQQPSEALTALLAKYVSHVQLEAKNYAAKHQVFDYVEAKFSTLKNDLMGALNIIAQKRVTEVIVKQHDMPAINMGVQHKNFVKLVKMCTAQMHASKRLNVWLYGPAGAGKTTAAQFVAKALTPDKFYALPALETGFQVLGYIDANGKYVTTLFRECWENGGTIILDEVDSYSPSAALALNGALANGHCAFPDKMVPRHKDCIIIAGANTTGLGGTMEYAGRMKQDAAFLDRYVMLHWPIDEALEDALVSNKPWLAIVRHVRQQVITNQVKGAMISPRAAIFGEAMLNSGLELDDVMDSVLKKSMSDAQWNNVKPGHHLTQMLR